MSSTKVFIVHGYMASPESHWFPWLKAELEQVGSRVSILKLPDSNNPKAKHWHELLKKEIKQPDENTILIGHSLGCITTLHFISELSESTRIGGLFCVAGFSENLPNLPMLNEFTDKKYDISRVKLIAPQRAVVVSANDSIVYPEFTQRLAAELEAPLHEVLDGGHFLGSDGFNDFPLILDELKKMQNGRI